MVCLIVGLDYWFVILMLVIVGVFFMLFVDIIGCIINVLYEILVVVIVVIVGLLFFLFIVCKGGKIFLWCNLF